MRRAVSSVQAAGVPHVIITSVGVTPEIEMVHEWAASSFNNIEIISRKDDPGCNECWLEGVRACKTSRISIIHDDDVVVPSYYEKIKNIIEDEVDLILIDAFMQSSVHKIPSEPFRPSPCLEGVEQGRVDPQRVLERLMLGGQLTFSPVTGIFRKGWAIEALEEASRSFTDEKWHVRPTMMVGNDLLLWIRNCQKSKIVHYERSFLAGYGEHEGSTTVSYIENGRYADLVKIYDSVRSYVSR